MYLFCLIAKGRRVPLVCLDRPTESVTRKLTDKSAVCETSTDLNSVPLSLMRESRCNISLFLFLLSKVKISRTVQTCEMYAMEYVHCLCMTHPYSSYSRSRILSPKGVCCLLACSPSVSFVAAVVPSLSLSLSG